MKRTSIAHAIFFTSLLLSSSAFSRGDIVKCVDSAGRVTLTDEGCAIDQQQVAVLTTETREAPALEAVAPRAPSVERYIVTRAPVLRDQPLRKVTQAAPLARDIMTLKAARLNMQMLDTADQAMRASRVAALN